MKNILSLIVILSCTVSLHAQNILSGEWAGAIEAQGQKLIVEFDIDGEPEDYSGTINIPQQGLRSLGLTRAEQNADSVFLAFSIGQISGSFQGTYQSDSLITGTYMQGFSSFPFSIEKQLSIPEWEEPGAGEELVIQNGNVNIGGTLVVPEGKPEAPLVIMISGSGMQDRDSNIFDFKPFALLAEHLKREGIASFRYDDRQMGKSTGSFNEATLDMLAEDVNAIIHHLQNSIDLKIEDMVVLGHSQGGVVAGKVAEENEAVDQLILMASTGVDLKRLLRFQVEQAFGEGIHSEEKIDQEIDLREQLMSAIRDGGNIEEVKSEYKSHYKSMLESLPEAQKAGIPDIDAFAERQASQLIAYYRSPQLQSLLFYDPTRDLENLDVPALVLFGGKDTQVTEELNRPPMEEALEAAGVNYKFEVIEEANHLFQKANTGQVAEYATLEKQFVDGFLEMISGWVLEKN